MKRFIYPVVAACCFLSLAACDGGTTLCIEEHNCSDSWCDNDLSQSLSECHRYFDDRYDECLDDMDRIRRYETTSCYNAYDTLNNCIFSHSRCTRSFDDYKDLLYSIENNECYYELQDYYDACERDRWYY